MENFESELKKAFFEESEQLFEEAEASLIVLETGKKSQDVLNSIFRNAHNFKGSTQSLSLEDLSKAAHHFEEVLSYIKNGKIDPNPAVCNVLFKTIDFFKNYVANLKKDFGFRTSVAETVRVLDSLINTPSSSLALEPASLGQTLAQLTASQINQSSSPPVEENLRVSLSKLDQLLNFVGELVLHQSMINKHREQGSINSEHALQILSYFEKLVHELQTLSLSIRMIPISPLFQKMRRSLRDISQSQEKIIDFQTEGEHVELDKTVLEKISDPISHLIRNAIDHGIESKEEREKANKPNSAIVRLVAEQKEDYVQITVSDDGRGLDRNKLIQKGIEKGLITSHTVLTDQEAYALIFKPGFSTKEQVTDISGRGVGMDVVLNAVEELKGNIQIQTELGVGTSFIISLPLSLSILTGMVVSIDRRKYVIPVTQLLETIEYNKIRIETSTGTGRMINLRGEVIPILSLSKLLHGNQSQPNEALNQHPGLITSHDGKKVSFEIDEIVGQQQIVLKKLGQELRDLPGIVAGAILNDGEPSLVLNLYDFIEGKPTYAAA